MDTRLRLDVRRAARARGLAEREGADEDTKTEGRRGDGGFGEVQGDLTLGDVRDGSGNDRRRNEITSEICQVQRWLRSPS